MVTIWSLHTTARLGNVSRLQTKHLLCDVTQINLVLKSGSLIRTGMSLAAIFNPWSNLVFLEAGNACMSWPSTIHSNLVYYAESKGWVPYSRTVKTEVPTLKIG